jgi:putative spermidine/putrescine transport system ATP-binding protein
MRRHSDPEASPRRETELHWREIGTITSTVVPDHSADFTTKGIPISIRGISKHYGSLKALDRVDLNVNSGEFVTLLGPSGSGKTTLLMALAGFILPTEGSIKFGDQEVVTLPPNKRNVGVVFQNYALFPHMSVEQNVAYPLRVRRSPRAVTAARVKDVLSLVHLSELADRRIDQLSGGQRQRVALARAIVFHPRILLMDEPLSALDKSLREEMQIEIRQLQRSLGITTVSVTHDQREALTMGDRVAVLNHGRLVQVDTPEQLYAMPTSSFVAGFVGETTLLKVKIIGSAPHLFGKPLKTRHQVPQKGSNFHLVLRAERLDILDNEEQIDHNIFTGKVGEIVYQGDTILIHVTLCDDSTIVVRRPAPRGHQTFTLGLGDVVRIGLHAADTIIVPEDHQVS